MDQQLPEGIGPYRIEAILGRGGMGVVYRARHEETGEPVAVKTVRLPRARSLAGIRREIHALAQLRHPGVVRVLDQGLHQGVPWYAMEFIRGESLRDHLRRLAGQSDGFQEAGAGRLTELLTLLARLCEPLAFLHGEGKVHRDLKPANVVIRLDRRPVLVDFGLASQFGGASGREALTVAGTMVGSMAYVAPEQIRGEYVDARADLYSLGCILYEGITGRRPFPGRDIFRVLQGHLREDPEPPSRLVRGVPDGLERLVIRLLAKQPRDRLGYAGDVARWLVELGAEPGIPPAAQPARSYLYRPGFTGRERVYHELVRSLEGISTGRGGLALVEGESGIGKTRLVMEVSRTARMRGITVITGDGGSGGDSGSGSPRARPLSIFRGLLRAVSDHCREHGWEACDRLLGSRGPVLALYEPSLVHLPGQGAHPEPAELPPAAARLRLFRSLAETMGEYARSNRLLLVLDDLQWVDNLSLLLLTHLVHREDLAGSGALILGACRSEEMDGALRRLRLVRGVRWHRLARMGLGEIASLAGDMLAWPEPPGSLVEFLHRRSEGNPFFVAEYLRAAVARGLLNRDDRGRWNLAGEDFTRWPLPDSLSELVQRRLEGMTQEADRLVQAAAVLGREADWSLVSRVAGQVGEPGLDGLDELLRRQVLEEREGDRVRFVHDQIRRVSSAAIPPDRRRALHREAALALEERPGGVEGSPGERGFHWERAGEPDRARDHYLRAARRVRARYAYRAAEQLYRSYLRLVREPDPESIQARCELAQKVLGVLGRIEEATDQALLALEEAGALDDPSARAPVLMVLGGILHDRGEMTRARGLIREARDSFRRSGDPLRAAQALSFLGALTSQMGELEPAVALQQEALEAFRRLEDPAGEAAALARLGSVYSILGKLEEALDLHQRALEILRRMGNRTGEAASLANLGPVHSAQGRMREARESWEQALAIYREVGDRRYQGRVMANLASAELELGRLGRAERLANEALELHRETGERGWEAVSLLNLGVVHSRQGNPEQALEHSGRALQVSREVGDRYSESIALVNLGVDLTRLGRLDEAQGLLEKAEHTLREVKDPYYLGHALIGLAGLDLTRSRCLEQGERRLEEAEGLFRELENPFSLGLCACVRARLSLARGEPTEEHLARARRLAQESEAGPDSALWEAIAEVEGGISPPTTRSPVPPGPPRCSPGPVPGPAPP